LYVPQFLYDGDPDERKIGFRVGLSWLHAAEGAMFFTDYGISEGMKQEIGYAQKIEKPLTTGALELFEVGLKELEKLVDEERRKKESRIVNPFGGN
jgi:hypothetical protein